MDVLFRIVHQQLHFFMSITDGQMKLCILNDKNWIIKLFKNYFNIINNMTSLVRTQSWC